MRAGVWDTTRYIPIHTLGDKIPELCKVLPAVHALKGCDITSKVGTKHAFIKADQEADAVISSGGVSVGDADYTKVVRDELGEIDFWKIAMKPGKPFAFGKLPNSVFFGLPGNPVSALVTAHMLAIPALNKMQNSTNTAPLKLNVKTVTDLRSPQEIYLQCITSSLNF